MSQNVSDTLQERGKQHGKFADNAKFSQTLRQMMRSSPRWAFMTQEQCEALEMIACKMSRIISGDANHTDHWRDIAGYATLAEQSISEPS